MSERNLRLPNELAASAAAERISTISGISTSSTTSSQNKESTIKPLKEQRHPGEKEQKTIPDVTFICPFMGQIRGSVTITNFRLEFVGMDKDSPHGFSVPLGMISSIEKVGGQSSKGENSYGIQIYCKYVRTLFFACKQENHSRRELFDKLQEFAFPLNHNNKFFAFSYKKEFRVNGWSIYDPKQEFSRMKLNHDSWKICTINEKYEFSDTYPAVFAVPRLATDEDIRTVAGFRSRCRIPVLSWINPESQATICRCSQPLVGMTKKRCREDEAFLKLIMEANAQCHKLFIIDARPNVNAMANRARGGGYESEDAYQFAEIQFSDIQNIHVMRESLRKLQEIVYPTIDDKHWLVNLDNTGWLQHIKNVLAAARKVADKIENGKNSVLVHCSDGWDRTAQVTSLAMLMLDKYYRTLTGFEVLIEKEWVSFGHMFAKRIGHGEDKHSDSDRSPVFLQFLDSVWQMMEMFPTSFEFNEDVLILIMDSVYNCLFGTFLYNCELERHKERVKEETQSLWSFVEENREDYLNPLYNPDGTRVLLPKISMRSIKLWKGYYMRWNMKMITQDPRHERLKQLLAVKRQLEKELQELQIKASQRQSQPQETRVYV